MPYFETGVIEGREKIVQEVINFLYQKSDAAEKLVAPTAATARWEHSSFTDPGEDWNKLHVYGVDGEELHCFYQSGY